jgi:hypothetical protein
MKKIGDVTIYRKDGAYYLILVTNGSVKNGDDVLTHAGIVIRKDGGVWINIVIGKHTAGWSSKVHELTNFSLEFYNTDNQIDNMANTFKQGDLIVPKGLKEGEHVVLMISKATSLTLDAVVLSTNIDDEWKRYSELKSQPLDMYEATNLKLELV